MSMVRFRRAAVAGFFASALLLFLLLSVNQSAAQPMMQDDGTAGLGGRAAPAMGEGEGRMRRHFKEGQGFERERRGRRGVHGRKRGREHMVKLARFIRFMKEYQEAIEEPHGAIGFAALGIKQYHKKAGNPLRAVEELEKMLEKTKGRKSRNVLLFAIRQVYEEEGKDEQVLILNRQILSENVGAGENP